MKYYFIEVKGEIVATEGVHYAQNWACQSESLHVSDSSYLYDQETHSIVSNLILTENIRAVPYAIYYTTKGIACFPPGHLYCYPGYGAAFEYYKENISKISNRLCISIPKEIEQTVLRGLFTDVFSTLELFLSDFILCMIYSNETFYNNAVSFYKTSKKCKNEVKEIERRVHDFFFNGVVYHKFDKVNDIFLKLIGIELPETTVLRKLLHKRNNIVHRFSYSNIDRMRIIELAKEDIENLITESNAFVYSIIGKV